MGSRASWSEERKFRSGRRVGREVTAEWPIIDHRWRGQDMETPESGVSVCVCVIHGLISPTILGLCSLSPHFFFSCLCHFCTNNRTLQHSAGPPRLHSGYPVTVTRTARHKPASIYNQVWSYTCAAENHSYQAACDRAKPCGQGNWPAEITKLTWVDYLKEIRGAKSKKEKKGKNPSSSVVPSHPAASTFKDIKTRMHPLSVFVILVPSSHLGAVKTSPGQSTDTNISFHTFLKVNMLVLTSNRYKTTATLIRVSVRASS